MIFNACVCILVSWGLAGCARGVAVVTARPSPCTLGGWRSLSQTQITNMELREGVLFSTVLMCRLKHQ